MGQAPAPGGCVTASELTQYAVSQVGTNALPALPARPGEDWQAAWRERLEATPIWMVPWLANQVDGPYWRQGSLAPAYEEIEAAILMFGGWMDSYIDPVFRMLDRCTAPRRAIVGNWVHTFPDEGYPGPNLDWLHEFVRFFDFWLKEEQNGAMDEPGLTWFQRDYAAPEAFPVGWPGSWRAARAYGPSAGGNATFWLSGGEQSLRGALDAQPATAWGAETFAHRATVGTSGGLSWGAGSAPNGLARDIRRDEVGLPVFISRPLDEPLAVLGPAVATLEVSSSMTVATLVVRLSDVAPDGTSSQVSMGILNLTHRNGHTKPEPMVPGRPELVRVALRSAGYRFAAGHRIGLSVGSSLWPVIWPSPESGSLTIHQGPSALDRGGSRLELPLAPADDDAEVPSFLTTLPDLDEVGGGRDDSPRWQVTEDVLAGTTTVSTHDGGETVLEDGGRLYSAESHDLAASDQAPAVANMTSAVRYVLERDGHRVEVDVDATTSSDAGAFRMVMDLRVRLDGDAFFDRGLDERIPRRLV
ncbi:MAG: CocE/NonD family hydrolase [Chloroflexota bacterium]